MDSTKQREVTACRPAVTKVAVLMEEQLRAHDAQHPNGWNSDPFSHLSKRGYGR